MSGPLLWLQNCLNKTADDRENDGECICQQKKTNIFQTLFFFLLLVILGRYGCMLHSAFKACCNYFYLARYWNDCGPFPRFVSACSTGPVHRVKWRSHGKQELPTTVAQIGNASTCKWTGVCLYASDISLSNESCDIILCCSPTPNLFCATVVWAELEKSIFRNDTELH